MGVNIILDLNEDKTAFVEIEEFCRKNNYSLTVEPIVISMIETGLSIIHIGEIDSNIDLKSIPKYISYTVLVITIEDRIDQSALLAFLKIFYQIPITYKWEGSKAIYYFANSNTPFMLRQDIYDKYSKIFVELLKCKLVSDNPIMDVVLKTYPNPNIKRLEKYHIWYIDDRSNADVTLKELNKLINQGYFCISNIAWKQDIKEQSVEQVYTAYGFKQLGTDCTCIGEHFISEECTYRYSQILKYNTKNFYIIPIHGPNIYGDYLDEEFFTTCLNSIDNDIVPTVPIKLNYLPDRRTYVAAVCAYAQTMCGVNRMCSFINDLDKKTESMCSRKNTCTYVSCQSMQNIEIIPFNNKGILFVKCGDIDSIIKIISLIEKNVNYIKIINVQTIDEGIDIRLNQWKNLRKQSIMLSDGGGIFVGLWHEENKPTSYLKKKLSKIKLNAQELETLASSMKNYIPHGKGYAYTGFYQITSNNEIILPGLLNAIPYMEPLQLTTENLIFKIVGLQCNIYLKKNNKLLIKIPTNGISNTEIASTMRNVVDKYVKGDFYTEWGKNYITLTKEIYINLFI